MVGEIIDRNKIIGKAKYDQRLRAVNNIFNELSDPMYYEKLFDFISHFFNNCYKHGSKLIVFGNGGSAADADHIVGEFRGRFITERRSINAISLSDSVATTTAIANDFGYEDLFRRQLDGIYNSGDSVIALTTSGKSKNIINALDHIRENYDINSMIITGFMDKQIKLYKYHLMIPIYCTKYTVARIQEATMFLLHNMCAIFDELCEDVINISTHVIETTINSLNDIFNFDWMIDKKFSIDSNSI